MPTTRTLSAPCVIIDPDNMVVAATVPGDIGRENCRDQTVSLARACAEQSPTPRGRTEHRYCGAVTPLLNDQEIAAWVRIEFSLAAMQHEVARAKSVACSCCPFC